MKKGRFNCSSNNTSSLPLCRNKCSKSFWAFLQNQGNKRTYESCPKEPVCCPRIECSTNPEGSVNEPRQQAHPVEASAPEGEPPLQVSATDCWNWRGRGLD